MPEIFVDADACPVKDEAAKVAARHDLRVTYVSNGGLRPSRDPMVRTVVVGKGADAADDWIVENLAPNDIVVTADIPLAARAVEAGCHVLGMNGRPFTEETIGMAVAIVTIWRATTSDQAIEPAFRESLFNLISIMSSTGFSSGSFSLWGSFAIIVGVWLGIIGACSGSSAAGLSVFRVQIMLSALLAEIRRIHMPHRLAPIKYDGRAVSGDTMDAIILYLGAYILGFGIIAELIAETGVDFESALFAAWTSIGNIGYGYGPLLARTGTFVDFPDPAKVLMIMAMIMGRLSLLSVFVIALPRFWRA